MRSTQREGQMGLRTLGAREAQRNARTQRDRDQWKDLARSDLSGTGPDAQHRGTRWELVRKTHLLERQTKDQKGKMEVGHAQN